MAKRRISISTSGFFIQWTMWTLLSMTPEAKTKSISLYEHESSFTTLFIKEFLSFNESVQLLGIVFAENRLENPLCWRNFFRVCHRGKVAVACRRVSIVISKNGDFNEDFNLFFSHYSSSTLLLVFAQKHQWHSVIKLLALKFPNGCQFSQTISNN